jgi:hypothetical protein
LASLAGFTGLCAPPGRPRGWLLLAALAIGCASGGSDTQFGSFSGPAPTNPTQSVATDDGGGTTDGPGTEGITADVMTSGTGDSADSTGAPVGSTSAGDSTGVGLDSSSDGSMDSMSGSTTGPPPPPAGSQPLTGMYAHCLVPAECSAGLSCLTISDGTNGFCTTTPCTNPATDCDPAPPGTASPPMCVDANDGAGGTVSICALDCTVAACPTGMVCTLIAWAGGDVQTCI